MKKLVCDECGKKYIVLFGQNTVVEGYCPNCIQAFETYENESINYDLKPRALTHENIKKFHHLNRAEIKDIFETIFTSVSKYRDVTTKQWRDQTLDYRMSSVGRDWGTHVDNVNNILDTVERFLRCERDKK